VDVNDTLLTGGVSIVAVGVLATLLTQAAKTVSRRVSGPTLEGGSTLAFATGISVLIMAALSLAGVLPEQQEAAVTAIVTLLYGVAAGGASVLTYEVAATVSEIGGGGAEKP
jgi:hypothetical protein